MSVEAAPPPAAMPTDRAPAPRERPRKPAFWEHLHPLLVGERTLRFSTTFGLGIAALTLLGMLVATGLLLALHYVPSGAEAYGSVVQLEYAIPYGRFVRAAHRIAADAVLVVSALHLARIVWMAAYPRRAYNWLVGLGLLGVLLLAAFSGYVLPWDQRAYWAARVVNGLLEYVPLAGMAIARLLFGEALSPAVLGRLHGLHVSAAPALVLALLVLHLWRIRRDGGLACEPSGREAELVPARPHLFGRELIVALFVFGAVLVLASLVSAPLGPAADLARPSNPEKAPWYFLGLQELASRSAVLGALVLPAALIAALAVLPFVDRGDAGVGRAAPARERWCWLAVAVATLGAMIAAYWTPASFSSETSTWPALVPLATAALGAVGCAGGLGRRAALRSAIVALATALALATLIGACRGADWTFTWPGQDGAAGAGSAAPIEGRLASSPWRSSAYVGRNCEWQSSGGRGSIILLAPVAAARRRRGRCCQRGE